MIFRTLRTSLAPALLAAVLTTGQVLPGALAGGLLVRSAPVATCTAAPATRPQAVARVDGAPDALRYAANAELAGPAYAGRQLLLFDPAGSGRIVEVVGDLATARRVAVLVPGVDNRLSDFDRGLGGVQRRSPAWQARQLQAASGPGVAVVAWLGYQPPAGVDLDAIRSDVARHGADQLVAFLRGLALTAPRATVTVVGHSYGSLVAGYAASRFPDDVTDLVTIGSPGLDVATCRDLHTHARVWAGRSPSDWTRWIPSLRIFGLGHGRKPTDPAFGARPLDVVDADGHDGYYMPATRSLANIAHVVAGE
jgi:pimeloyl-ACP methyl ester carboxylesterase